MKQIHTWAALAACFLLQAGAALAEAPSIHNSGPPEAPINVIFDTDMWSDIDDAMALAMLHALQDRREINLLAVTISTSEKWCASYVDLIDTFYGHPQIPIGLIRNGLDASAFRKKYPTGTWPVTRYTQILAEKRNQSGSLVYPHKLIDGNDAPETVALLRKTLAAQPDGSVVIVEVGYTTNLARLLDSTPDAFSPLRGVDLIRQKVRLLSVMAGNFAQSTFAGTLIPKGSAEFNLASDVPSAQTVFSTWPTPIVDSGYEVGLALLFPAVSIERDFSYVYHHPVADTYRTYAEETKRWPHNHPTYDLTAVLYAARPDRNYFSLSQPGRITVLDNGGSRFEEREDGTHRHLILSEEQKARALEAMVMLVSQPPRRTKQP